MFTVHTKELGKYDVCVCGGGIAGVCAAISAKRAGASVILIERQGALGGTLTEGHIPLLLDSDNKGGLVKELYSFLDEHEMTCNRRGALTDESGRKLPGRMVDTEGCKYFFEKMCFDLGVQVLYHSQVSAVNIKDGAIDDIFIATECGNYSLSADIFIDATGGGALADLAGCSWDCGDPYEKNPSPASFNAYVVGLDKSFSGIEGYEGKIAYAEMLRKNGIDVSAGAVSCRKLPNFNTWGMGLNFEYGVMPDDIGSLSRAVSNGRLEVFEAIEKHKKLDGYSELFLSSTASHIGIREGRRIYGEYRITDDDIISGRRFDDAVCLVTATVDVHKLKPDDTLDCQRGVHTKPYNIPYRALVPKGCNNLLLAGRCISGDFYPHSSYRMMGNMAATGEAAGFAAAGCVKGHIQPKNYDGLAVKEFMQNRGYEI